MRCGAAGWLGRQQLNRMRKASGVRTAGNGLDIKHGLDARAKAEAAVALDGRLTLAARDAAAIHFPDCTESPKMPE